VHDVRGNPTTFVFDMVDGKSPLIVGLDVKKHSNTMNIERLSTVIFKKPSDTLNRDFLTYIANENGGNEWLRIEFVAQEQSAVASDMAKILKRTDVYIVKKIAASRMPIKRR